MKALASWINQTALNADESAFCQRRMHYSPVDLIPSTRTPSFRKEIPNNRYLIDGKRSLRVATTYT